MSSTDSRTASRTARVSLVIVLIGAAVAGLTFLPVGRWALALVTWIRGAGALGASVFSVAYLVATVLLLPGSMLTLGAGFAYGPIVGTLLVSPISVLAATASFLVARFVARDWVSRKVARDPRFDAVDAAVGENERRARRDPAASEALMNLQSAPNHPSSTTRSAALVRPNDAHDRTLVAHVHPPDWVNPRPAGRYNLVVIGGGTAGLVSAMGAAGLGARVALVERHLLGGDCLNYVCVPSKALIRAARAVFDAQGVAAFGGRPNGDVSSSH